MNIFGHIELIFEAPYSPGLILRQPGDTCTQEKAKVCQLCGFH